VQEVRDADGGLAKVSVVLLDLSDVEENVEQSDAEEQMLKDLNIPKEAQSVSPVPSSQKVHQFIGSPL